MVKQETVTINGMDFDRSFSDSDFYIERDGVRYAEAVDPKNSGRTYTETTEKIEATADMNE